ncbi:MAG: tyrosine-protein phosphatase [Dysgonamonadaceae bacterium]|jgi:protein-tyrosine phosphatase|nr:tyrosine-protein phosphatase [Dysgonamonadaceae bacterium]
MVKKAPLSLLTVLLFAFCVQEKPDIRVICENSAGNYRIKWETFPPMEGTVNIYESNKPDSFDIGTPLAVANIGDGFKDVFALRNLSRSYFKLVFNNKYSVITGERAIPMQQLANFRDFGGYGNEDNRQTQWGKLYRSSSLSYATTMDRKLLNSLKIKTIIDFSAEHEKERRTCCCLTKRILNLPLRENLPSTVFFSDKILSKQMRKNDVIIAQQDNLSFVMEHNADYFEQMFDILTDRANYPVVLCCALGKDKTGVAAALVLSALGIDREQIIGDFLLSNQLIDYDIFLPNVEVYFSDYDVQETMTAMLSAHPEVITYILDRVNKLYGSMNYFLENEVKLSARKREKLKEILLYPQDY